MGIVDTPCESYNAFLHIPSYHFPTIACLPLIFRVFFPKSEAKRWRSYIYFKLNPVNSLCNSCVFGMELLCLHPCYISWNQCQTTGHLCKELLNCALNLECLVKTHLLHQHRSLLFMCMYPHIIIVFLFSIFPTWSYTGIVKVWNSTHITLLHSMWTLSVVWMCF